MGFYLFLLLLIIVHNIVCILKLKCVSLQPYYRISAQADSFQFLSSSQSLIVLNSFLSQILQNKKIFPFLKINSSTDRTPNKAVKGAPNRVRIAEKSNE